MQGRGIFHDPIDPTIGDNAARLNRSLSRTLRPRGHSAQKGRWRTGADSHAARRFSTHSMTAVGVRMPQLLPLPTKSAPAILQIFDRFRELACLTIFFSSRHVRWRRPCPGSVLTSARPRRRVRSVYANVEWALVAVDPQSCSTGRPNRKALPLGAIPLTRRRLGRKKHEGPGNFRHCIRRRHHVILTTSPRLSIVFERSGRRGQGDCGDWKGNLHLRGGS